MDDSTVLGCENLAIVKLLDNLHMDKGVRMGRVDEKCRDAEEPEGSAKERYPPTEKVSIHEQTDSQKWSSCLLKFLWEICLKH